MPGRVEDEPREVARGRSCGAPREHLDTGDQLQGLEGLGQVVLGPDAETGELVVHAAQGGQEHHRRCLPVGAQCLADVAAVGVGEADVDDQHVERPVVTEQPDGLAAVVRGHDLVTGQVQGLDDDAADRRVVLAEADSCHDQDSDPIRAGTRQGASADLTAT